MSLGDALDLVVVVVVVVVKIVVDLAAVASRSLFRGLYHVLQSLCALFMSCSSHGQRLRRHVIVASGDEDRSLQTGREERATCLLDWVGLVV